MNAPAPEFFPAGPLEIRDGTLARLKAITGFDNVWAQRALPVKDDQVPFAIVWHGGEKTEPMGDANVGIPSFDHTLRLVLNIATTADTPDGLDPAIVEVTERVKGALLTDPAWLALFEACTKIDTTYSFPGEGTILYALGMIEFDVTYRSEWPPVGGDDLDEVAVTAGAGPNTYFHQSFPLGNRS